MKLLTIFITLLVGANTMPGSPRCTSRPSQQLTSAQKFQHFRQFYLFVENNLSTNRSNQTQTNGGINLVSGGKQGSSYCPWSWAVDDDPNRIPRYLVKAECSSCRHYCRAVFYTHNALVQRCDRTTGEIIWKRKEKTLQIAYLYDP